MARLRNPEIILELFEHVLERRWRRCWWLHGKRQPMSLARAVIGVLAEDHDSHGGERSEVQGCEHVVVRRVDGVLRALVCDKGLKLSPVVLLELGPKKRVPIGGSHDVRIVRSSPVRRLLITIVSFMVIAAACTGTGDLDLSASGDGSTSAVDDAPTTAAPPTAAPTTTTAPTTTPTTPPPTTAPPTTIDPIQLRVDAMTVEAKVGQLLMPLLNGVAPGSAADPNTPAGVVAQYELGGVIYLGTNVGGAAQLTDLSGGLQGAAPEGIGLFVSIDQEGGRVARVTDGVTAVPSARTMGTRGAEAVFEASALSGTELSTQGINMVLAPVADLAAGNAGVIGDRSYSGDPAIAAEMVTASVTGLESSGVAAVVKHWPGHGATSIDSHQSLPTVDIGLVEWQNRELVPFAAAFDADVSAVMVGHLSFPQLDPSGVPATVSPALIDGLLREESGFDGVVMTDALDMGAVSNFDQGELAVLVILAGGDILLAPGNLTAARDGVLAAVADGRIPMERLDQSVTRILTLKSEMGLLDAS